MSDQNRFAYLKRIQHLRQRNQGLVVHESHRTRQLARIRLSVSRAAVDQRARSSRCDDSLRKAFPHRHAAEALVKKDKRRRFVRTRAIPFVFELLTLDSLVRHSSLPENRLV